ncbi:PAS domain S-box/diguanylate cyclase (GGDEF) domain-containing protein [Acidovorax sp. CF316]|uniref:diguanylate cyclase domain-containing protein n=1 Tax=Acidovorax sp. CF316 TaxID=1144317 RepID=UPI00026BE85B|nr:diguanylate cyclase [Acidovorax sp. CF316]EJE48702.1 PAS domain S-box/diguanylate cyclase (GGDEF) domain-containing protein [Acidovorax sp. CF316]
MFVELVKGAALLLALCFLHGANIRLWRRHPRVGKAFSGLLFGGICIVGMLSPLTISPGVIIDARSVVLCMAGLFGGTTVALIAGALSAAWRMWLGGAGALVGVLSIATCVAAGLAYRHARQRWQLGVGIWPLLVFGVLLHLAVVGLFQALPAEVAARINDTVAVPYLMIFPVATAMLGLLLRDVEQRQATDFALVGSAARLRAITQAIPDALVVLDAQGRCMELFSHHEGMHAAGAPQRVGQRMHDMLPSSEAQRLGQLLQDTLAAGAPRKLEYTVYTASGIRYFEGRAQPLGTEVDGQAAVLFLARDITERWQAQQALHESELRFRSLLLGIPSVSVQGYRADGTTTYWNKASEELYGYTEQEALGSNLLELIIPEPMHEAVAAQVAHMFSSGEPIPAGELRLERKDGSPVDVFSSHAYVHVPGQEPEMFCIDIDISRRKAAEEEARRLALYDTLTQLPNRRLLTDRLEQVMAASSRSGQIAAALFIDLDHFKALNDSRGHAVGDLLLREVATRLRACVREQDTVARLGGDEFVVLLQSLGQDAPEATDKARAVGENMLAALREPYDLGGQPYHCEASIGVSLVSGHALTVDEVLRQADNAMYQAKTMGRNRLYVYLADAG